MTWTSSVELLRLTEADGPTVESLLRDGAVALDARLVSDGTRDLLADFDRRQKLQQVVERLSDHSGEVIARWATVMVGAAPYAEILDRHVELQGRLEWLSSGLAQREPAPDLGDRSRRLNRAGVATEQASSFGDDWVHDMVVSITLLAIRLDFDSRELAISLVPAVWWAGRTQDLIGS